MNIIQTNIDGVLIIEPHVFKDSRGYFFESFSQREFDAKVTPYGKGFTKRKGLKARLLEGCSVRL